MTSTPFQKFSGYSGPRGIARDFMSRKFFGTDGIRGRTNAWPMTAELAMKIGMAAGAHFQRGTHRPRVVIGQDTRLSGYLVENEIGRAWGRERVGQYV